jgi:hypothetical protein
MGIVYRYKYILLLVRDAKYNMVQKMYMITMVAKIC